LSRPGASRETREGGVSNETRPVDDERPRDAVVARSCFARSALERWVIVDALEHADIVPERLEARMEEMWVPKPCD